MYLIANKPYGHCYPDSVVKRRLIKLQPLQMAYSMSAHVLNLEGKQLKKSGEKKNKDPFGCPIKIG